MPMSEVAEQTFPAGTQRKINKIMEPITKDNIIEVDDNVEGTDPQLNNKQWEEINDNVTQWWDTEVFDSPKNDWTDQMDDGNQWWSELFCRRTSQKRSIASNGIVQSRIPTCVWCMHEFESRNKLFTHLMNGCERYEGQQC